MVIRRQPSDFMVEEMLTSKAAGAITELPGPGRSIAAFRLTKRSLSTPEAVSKLARAVGVKPGEISYAGLKDKHAITTQAVTVGGIRDSMRLSRSVGNLVTDGFAATLFGWAHHHAEASWIELNRFEVVVRGLDTRDVETLQNAIKGFQDSCDPARLILLNEFGEQRFGSARHGQGFAAPALIAGDFEHAVKLLIATPARKDSGTRRTLTRVLAERWGNWVAALEGIPKCPERRAVEVLAGGGDFRAAFQALPEFTRNMAVESYQSWLWNQIARRVVAEVAPERRAEISDLLLPTLGPGVVLKEPWAAAARHVLAEEGLDPETMRIPGLRRPSFGVAERPLFMIASAFAISEPFADELAPARSTKPLAVRLAFTLPRGSYATVLLRAIGC